MATEHTSAIPAKAVAPQGGDLVKPTSELLRGLGLLPESDATAGPGAAITGGPDSIAVIQSTATAISKAWAAGLGTAVAGLWASVGTWWAKQNGDMSRVGVLLGRCHCDSSARSGARVHRRQ